MKFDETQSLNDSETVKVRTPDQVAATQEFQTQTDRHQIADG